MCDFQVRWIRWMRRPFAFQTGHFLEHKVARMASRIVKVSPLTSASNISRFRGMFLS
jgi:hypothetical protein